MTGAERLVLVVEPGYPFSGGLVQRLAAAASLGLALPGFRHVRLVLAGPPPLPPPVWKRLARLAGEVDTAPPGPTTPGVTPVGPPELPLSARPRQLTAVVARRVFGRDRAAAARRRLNL
jgi:hypothetical protein